MKNNLDRIQEFFLKELYIWKRVTDRKDTKSLKFLEKHRSRREWKNSYFLDDKASFSGKEEFRFVPDKIQSQWYLINLCLINRDTLSSTTEIRSFFGRYSIDSVRYVKRWPKNEPLLPFFSLLYTIDILVARIESLPQIRQILWTDSRESWPVSFPPPQRNKKKRISPWNDAR